MNSYLVEQIKEGRLRKKLKQSDVAKMLGIKGNTLSNYENGVSEPDIDTFLKLCEIYELDYASILEEAYKYRSPNIDFSLNEKEQDIILSYRSLSDAGKTFAQTTIKSIVGYENNQKTKHISQKRIKIPTGTLVDFHEIKDIDDTEPCKLRPVKTTLQSLSAGCGSIGDDDQYTEINYPDEKVPDGTDFASKITGDSMEPTFFDGDIVFYELTQNLREGDIGVFRKNDENFIKEYRKDGLVSHNPAYDVIVPGMDDHIETIGKVLGKL